MSELLQIDAYGELIGPDTLQIKRRLPGPIERVWAYLTDSELRRKWLASGDMKQEAGETFELTWRNDELTDPPGRRPEGFSGEHSMQSRVLELDAPRKLSFTFGTNGEVTFELEPHGDGVLLTVTHRHLPSREVMLKVAAGWHAHLDVLAARAAGHEPEPFWDRWAKLFAGYQKRIPG
jgi:uncharacterized protein YndB with AHSA1/START domain